MAAQGKLKQLSCRLKYKHKPTQRLWPNCHTEFSEAANVTNTKTHGSQVIHIQ